MNFIIKFYPFLGQESKHPLALSASFWTPMPGKGLYFGELCAKKFSIITQMDFCI